MKIIIDSLNYKFMCLSAYWQWKLANERTRISAVIVKNYIDCKKILNISTLPPPPIRVFHGRE